MGERRDETEDEAGGGSRRGGPAWAAMLHPAEGVRALGEIQRQGLRAAGELVDRLVAAVDGDQDEQEVLAGDRAGHPTAAPAADLVRVWLELLQRGVEALSGPADGGGGAGIARADLGAGTTTGVVRLQLDGEGPGSAEVWLHNGTREAIAGIRLHGGELRTHDGAVLPATTLRFDPPVVELPGRSSRGVAVAADVDGDAVAGVYRGVVLAAGNPDVWLPVEVTVARGGAA